MNFYTLLFNFDEDFTTFTKHIANSLLQSGLLLDEHEYQILAHFETSKLNDPMDRRNLTNGHQFFKFFQHVLSVIISKNISRYFEDYYKSTFDDLIQCCRKQSFLNISVKRHFERRLSFIKVLDIEHSLKGSTLVEQEIAFLNDFSLLLTQTNKSMMGIKESTINYKMNTLGFQLFETNYSKGSDMYESFDAFKIIADTFIYNTSEFLTALVLSFLHRFKLDDAVVFHNLNIVIPNFLRSFTISLEESEKMFEKTKYLLIISEESNSSRLISKDNKLIAEDLVNHHLNETLRTLQITFEMISKVHKNYNMSSDISDKDLDTAKVCLSKSLENISYLYKLIHAKSIKTNDDNKLLSSAISAKENNKVIVVDNIEEKQMDEVFSCYISEESEVSSNKQYDDLFQNYTSQKMLITELQEKLHLLTNLHGRKIAPEPGDQILPIKEEASSVPNVLENNVDINVNSSKDIGIPSPPPCPPKMPVFNIQLENNFGATISLANEVKEIANRNKRDEEVFGSEDSSCESADEL